MFGQANWTNFRVSLSPPNYSFVHVRNFYFLRVYLICFPPKGFAVSTQAHNKAFQIAFSTVFQIFTHDFTYD